MLAVVKELAGAGFAVKDVPYPVLREDDVIVRVRSVGICGTDGPILAGTREVPRPLIPGHEFAGDVVEVGARVKNLKPGDRVTPCIVIGCGDCDMCIEGKEVLCDNLVETGIHVDGAFAEYVRVPAKVCRKMKDSTTYDQGASVDPIASAYRTVKASSITSKDVCVVYGPGPIGLYAVQLIRLRGAKKIICIGTDVDQERLKLAGELGADVTINASVEDPVERVREITGGRMADYVQDCVGVPGIPAAAMSMLKKGGTYAVTGLYHSLPKVDLGKVVRSEIKIYGTICYTRQEFEECLDFVEDGRVKVEPLITHHYPLKEMEEAFAVMQSKQCMKIIMHP
jgi:2-desacetyl-2-hydroxyethyl bacteriochlorophyllide A dehydrogenase